MAEKNNFFRFLHCQFKKISYFCKRDSVLRRFLDILNNEAPCFILTKREPENFHYEGGECRAVVSALLARTSVIFHLQGFLRTSVEEYRHEVCASVYIMIVQHYNDYG